VGAQDSGKTVAVGSEQRTGDWGARLGSGVPGAFVQIFLGLVWLFPSPPGTDGFHRVRPRQGRFPTHQPSRVRLYPAGLNS
jgi:hypothetical protein